MGTHGMEWKEVALGRGGGRAESDAVPLKASVNPTGDPEKSPSFLKRDLNGLTQHLQG